MTKAIRRGERYIRREVGRLEGRARCSSFPSLDHHLLCLTALLYYDHLPLLRLPTRPPIADLAAVDLSPGLLRRRRLLSGQYLCYCPVPVLANALIQVHLFARRRYCIDPVSRLYSSSYPRLPARPFSVAFAPCPCFYLGQYPCTCRLLSTHHLSSRLYQRDCIALPTWCALPLPTRLAGH